jgi:hypothetical protein
LRSRGAWRAYECVKAQDKEKCKYRQRFKQPSSAPSHPKASKCLQSIY